MVNSKKLNKTKNIKNKNDIIRNKILGKNKEIISIQQILNRTKSVLNNKSDFSEYMKGYDSLITKSTFKTPEINSYPLLRKNHSELISAKNQNRAQNKIIRRKNT